MSEPMTTQQIFDKVATHLLTQRDKAMSMEMCRYRTPEGLSCAVGCLITDEHYSRTFEGEGIGPLGGVRKALESSIARRLTPSEVQLLTQLQCVHDDSHPAEWLGALYDAAETHNLTFQVDMELVKSFILRFKDTLCLDIPAPVYEDLPQDFLEVLKEIT